MTNILALPLVQIGVYTGTNEDWVDTIQFLDLNNVGISLAGITFAMEARKQPLDATVLLSASSANGYLSIAGTDQSYLAIQVPASAMDDFSPDVYVADIVAYGDGHARVIVQVNPLQIFAGITR
jgi:hypothetical protein